MKIIILCSLLLSNICLPDTYKITLGDNKPVIYSTTQPKVRIVTEQKNMFNEPIAVVEMKKNVLIMKQSFFTNAQLTRMNEGNKTLIVDLPMNIKSVTTTKLNLSPGQSFEFVFNKNNYTDLPHIPDVFQQKVLLVVEKIK